MKRNTKFFAAMLAAVMIFSAGVYSNPDRIYANQKLNENVTNAQADTAVSGIQVAYHTQKEIVDYVKAHPAGKNDKLTYKKNPSFSGTYNIGEISAATQNSALNMLKQIRYIAGISDEITVSDEYTKLTQATAYINYANDELSHYPDKPKNIPDNLYDLGAQGACQSNIAWASWNGCSLNYTLIDSWMEDADSYNIDRVGHRRWLLNPKMSATGFGAVDGTKGTYSAVYAFDEANTSATEYGVCWPAQNMPTEYFESSYPWSVSTGDTEDISKIQVVLKNVKTGKTWNFSSMKADGSFYVNNDNYGDRGCIIFRPKNIATFKAGDCYSVNITGTSRGTVSYKVRFFDLYQKEVEIPYIREYTSKADRFNVKWYRSHDADGYQIQYSTNAKFKSKKTKELTGTSITVKHAINKKYYFQIRAYCITNGKRVYSKWSNTIKL